MGWERAFIWLGVGFYWLRMGLHELGMSLDGLVKNCRGRDMGLSELGRVGMVGIDANGLERD